MKEALDVVREAYARLPERISNARQVFGRPMTLVEKILVTHTAQPLTTRPQRQRDSIELIPDRVALQDATAQMAILQFMSSGRTQTSVPATVHCDHLVVAQHGAQQDLAGARTENSEVYDFLRSACARYGMGFWEPGAGIIHQVVLEQYAFPGGLIIGTDSHTPNAGGLGMFASGVGGSEAVDALVGEPWVVRWPGLIGVRLTGRLNGWASSKDVILHLMSVLTVKGGTHCAVEFFGPGVASVSATGRGTICNMGAEHGATTSVFPFDERTAEYLRATGRTSWAQMAETIKPHLSADPETAADPNRFYDRVIEIDLSSMEPQIAGPHTPDLVRPLSSLGSEAHEKKYPVQLSYALVGSCTNSSYEDMSRAASVAREAKSLGLTAAIPLMVTPGSQRTARTLATEGQLDALRAIGAQLGASACGPCIGQWKRTDPASADTNSIITSYNRNFAGRNDGSSKTLAFIASPEIVTAMALAGRLDFHPARDTLPLPDGRRVRLTPPTGDSCPSVFDIRTPGYVPPPEDASRISVAIRPDSQRLQALEPFAPWDGRDLLNFPILAQVTGKCTTDHISPAGKWLRFRGHLDRISDNMLLGAVNRHTRESGHGRHPLTGEASVPFAAMARDLQKRGMGWVIVGDENYGEGSSREHAAMSPRYLGCRAVIVRSFARIHETNLKKQGILPLTFADPADYDRMREDDRISIKGLSTLAAGRDLTLEIIRSEGAGFTTAVRHSLTPRQIEWFRAGSSLNTLRKAPA